MRGRLTKSTSQASLVAIVLLVLIAILSSNGLRTVHGGLDRHLDHEQIVRVGVLGLFHPRELIVSTTAGHALLLQGGDQSIVLERSGSPSATLHFHNSEVLVTSGSQTLRATTVRVADRENEPVAFTLEIPGKIVRRYHGMLEVKPSSADLVAIVALDLETAVASVVAAESAPDTPIEALKAHAIAARSYFVSGRGRHREFDFCDTTHCQVFRTPPNPESRAAIAAAETNGLVLSYQERPFAAMYTRSCSGRTRTPAELGLGVGFYPYYAVECEHCRTHPSQWTSRLSSQDAASLRAGN